MTLRFKSNRRRALGIALAAWVLSALTVREATAQAWSYPSFQPPRLTVRELNFGVADAGGPGTAMLFQWREQTGPRHQVSFDVGLADRDQSGDELILFGGVGVAWLASAATDEVPLDFVMTAGGYVSLGHGTRFRLPVGVSVGKRFDLEGDMALTPYLHPRLSLDLCNGCGRADLGVSFDLGASLALSQTISVRGSALFTGTDSFYDEGFGVSIAWTPPALAGSRVKRKG